MKRSVKLTPPCSRCGSTSASWKGPRLYCSCDMLIREKGRDRILASYRADRWPIASQTRHAKAVKAVLDAKLAKQHFEEYGCCNGQYCDDDQCWKH